MVLHRPFKPKLIHSANNMNRYSNAANTENLEWFCSTLKVLSNPNRFRIMLMLAGGEHSVGEIEEMLSIKQPNLSQELRLLRDANLVKTRRNSKVIFYSIFGERETNLIHYLSKLSQSEDSALAFEGLGIQPILNKSLSNSKPGNRSGECGHFSSVRYL